MGKKKSLCFSVGLFFIIAWVCGSIKPAAAETLKCKSESDTDVYHMETLGPVAVNFENLYYGYGTRVGSVSCDKGETATFWNCGSFAMTLENGGLSQGITVLTFKDSSKIVIRHSKLQRPDPEKKVRWILDSTAEILNGYGRFKGIQGSVSISGKQLSNPKNTAIEEMTITYTLPPK